MLCDGLPRCVRPRPGLAPGLGPGQPQLLDTDQRRAVSGGQIDSFAEDRGWPTPALFAAEPTSLTSSPSSLLHNTSAISSCYEQVRAWLQEPLQQPGSAAGAVPRAPAHPAAALGAALGLYPLQSSRHPATGHSSSMLTSILL